MELSKMTAMEAKLDDIMHRMDKQERKLHTAHEIEAVERELMRRSAEVPTAKDSYGAEEVKYVNEQRSYNFKPNPNLPTHYNPALRNHENFSYGGGALHGPRQEQHPQQGYHQLPRFQQQQQGGGNKNEYQGQRRIQPFEEQMLQFMGDNKRLLHFHEMKLSDLEAFKSDTQMFQKNTSASLKNLETQVGQLALNVPNQNKGTFPSDTQKNPKDCMAIQLRSGKDLSSSKKTEGEEETEAEKGKTEEKEERNSQLDQLKGSNDQKKKEGVPAYAPAVPFPQRLQKSRREEQFSKFLDIFKKIEINIPFAEVISQMPFYAKFMKKILSKKRKLAEEGIVNLIATCSAIIQQKLLAKMKDPGSFTIPCSIGKYEFKKALCDSGASINLMPLSVVQRLSLGELTPTAITSQMADRSMAQPEGILEDVLVKVGKFVFPVDFVVMKMEEDTQVPLLMGRPFLATGAALIDVQKGELTLRVGDEVVQFNINRSLEHPNVGSDSCMAVRNTSLLNDELNSDCIIQHSINEIEMNFQYLESFDCEVLPSNLFNKETVSSINENSQNEESIQEQQTHDEETSAEGLTLKELPSHLKYEFLEPEKRKPVIISAALTEAKEKKLLTILRKYKKAIAWSIEDLKGISPSICMHKILLEDNAKTSIEHQRRLNPVMKEVVRKEVLKWLNAGFIYAISNSSWVSPVHVVPKKGGFTVIRNEKNELIPTTTVTR